MKIGIFLNETYSPKIGGGFSYTKTLLKSLAQSNTKHKFIFIAKTSNKRTNLPFLERYLNRENCIFYMPEELRFALSFRIFNKLLKLFSQQSLSVLMEIIIQAKRQKQKKDNGKIFLDLVKENKIDLIYYADPFNCANLDVPFFTTVWDLGHLKVGFFPEVSANNKFDGRENGYRKILPRAARIIAESETGKEDICKHYGIDAEKIAVVPMFPGTCINIKFEKNKKLLWLQKNRLKEKNFLFYPANFWPHKNHINILKAINYLRRDNKTEIKLILTGSAQGNLNYILRKIKDYQLGEQVFYFGFLSEEEIKILYDSALALIMPTFIGPTNMPILEALASGCPVICSALEGHRAMAKDGALYVKPDDPYDIAEKIKVLISNTQLRNDLAKRGKRIYETGVHTVKNAVNSLLNAFDAFESIRNCWE